MTISYTKFLNNQKNEKLCILDKNLRSNLEKVLIEHPLPDERDILKPTSINSFEDFISEKFIRLQLLIQAQFGEEKLARYNKLICLKLLFNFDRKVKKESLPKKIISQYPLTIEYIAESLLSDDLKSYNFKADYFTKDLRILLMQSLPGGAQIIDQSSYLSNTFFRYNGKKENFRRLLFILFRIGNLGPLFRIHTENRYLDCFNLEGWNNCYLRIVELFGIKPEIRGLIATSWFYDPQLKKISPHLSYLREVPCNNGAFLIHDGPGEIHTKRAIKTSKTRRKLFQEGKYLPTCYTIIWPKKDMIEWNKFYEEK
jgi:hypothetical protein